MKVLLSVYACEPGSGSEPGVGWNCLKQMAQCHEVWAITLASNRASIDRAHSEDRMPASVHWVYFDLPGGLFCRGQGGRWWHLHYYLWQIGAYLVARRLHRAIQFDLVHHVTFVNYWMPSLLPLLPVPFVWGPVGGGESTPPPFYKTFSYRARLYEHLRNIVRRMSHWDPFVRLTAKRAQLALATTPDTAQRMRDLGSRCVEILSESALSSEEISRLALLPARQGGPFRLISIGNLLHLKGFHLALMAFREVSLEYPESEYWLVGDGPERGNLEALAVRLGVGDRSHFWGRLPRQETLKKLSDCDVLVHPTLHDSGGWVCLEAMAAGRPVVCLDLGGPALQVTPETGVRVPAIAPEQAVRDMAETIKQLAADPEGRRQMGVAGQARIAKEFSWQARGKVLQTLYARICQA